MAPKHQLSTDPYKGVRDFYPEDQAVLRYLTSTMRDFVERFGYEEYHASILEPAELYRAKGAENEEIINDQTYTFVDRGDREVTLRPEMTPTAARMVAAKRRELAFPLRWYSIPNVFRYERPQRGRLREHWQLNVDLFGSANAAAEVELISMAHGLMHAFGATERDFEIHVSSRVWLERLIATLGVEEQKYKLIRLLDTKAKMGQDQFEKEMRELGVSPLALSQEEVPEDVAAVLKPLQEMGLSNVRFDHSVVRGFSYYSGVVFEVFDTHPDNNRSLFGGGRYDNLLELFGGEKLPAVGFGMGDVGLRDFLEVRGLIPPYRPAAKVYLALASPDVVPEAMALAGELRQQNINAAIDFGDKKLGDQLKAADKRNIPYVIVVGRDELASGRFAVRDMATREEKILSRQELGSFFLNLNA